MPWDTAGLVEEEEYMSDLVYEVQDGVATVRLNRPERSNAFTMEMIDAWAAAYRDAQRDPDVRVVVVTGTGRSFCAGADLGQLDATQQTPLERKELLAGRVHAVAHAAEDLDKPLVAAVNGAAVGAGMDMALMADIRLAARSARFSEGYVRLGIVPGNGGCYYLPRLIGTAKAMELLLTGDTVDAVEAERLGIVNHVHEDDELPERTRDLARRIADGPPVALRMIKRAVRQSAGMDLRTALDLASSHMAVAQSTEDAREALRAYGEKRAPHFLGR